MNEIAPTFWSTIWPAVQSPLGTLILGILLGFYVSVIFSKFQHWGELIGELGRARIHNEGYPTGPRVLERALRKAEEFWRLVERINWDLNADEHYAAALETSLLRGFAYVLGDRDRIDAESAAEG
jgi:hypothetical protein